MKIQMRVTAAGPQGVKKAGRVYDLPDVEARGLLAGGYASLAPSDVKPEAAKAPAKSGKDYVPAPEPAAAQQPAPVAPPASAPQKSGKNR